MSINKEHIIVGMSGGVDSSVTAALLCEQGYRVTGLFMRNWDSDDKDPFCTATQDLTDARTVCDKLGIPLKTVNFAQEYRRFAAIFMPRREYQINFSHKLECKRCRLPFLGLQMESGCSLMNIATVAPVDFHLLAH